MQTIQLKVWYFLVGLVIGYCLIVTKAECKLYELDSVYVNFKNYFPNSHNPLLTDGSTLNKGVNLGVETTIFKYFYANSLVWSLADQHQFRWIGWNYTLGLRIFQFLDLEYDHFSKHILDKEYPYKNQGRFPVEDSIGFKLYFFKREKRDTVF